MSYDFNAAQLGADLKVTPQQLAAQKKISVRPGMAKGARKRTTTAPYPYRRVHGYGPQRTRPLPFAFNRAPAGPATSLGRPRVVAPGTVFAVRSFDATRTMPISRPAFAAGQLADDELYGIGDDDNLGFSLKPPKFIRKLQPGKLLKKAAIPLAIGAAALIPGVAPAIATVGKGLVTGAAKLVTGPAGLIAKNVGAAGSVLGVKRGAFGGVFASLANKVAAARSQSPQPEAVQPATIEEMAPAYVPPAAPIVQEVSPQTIPLVQASMIGVPEAEAATVPAAAVGPLTAENAPKLMTGVLVVGGALGLLALAALFRNRR